MDTSFVKKAYRRLLPHITHSRASNASTRSNEVREPASIQRPLQFETLPADSAEALRQAVELVTSEQALPDTLLLQLLSLERKDHRVIVNAHLADAFVRIDKPQEAMPYIQRAWIFSNFHEDLLGSYVGIHSSLTKTELVREAYKRAGINAARSGDADKAIRFFDLWQYVHASHEKIDRYEYDFDILDAMNRLTDSARFEMRPLKTAERAKIKVGYFLRGLTETNSCLMNIMHAIAEHQDSQRYELTFFAIETPAAVKASKQGVQHVERLQAAGHKVVLGTESASPSKAARLLAESIHAAEIDMLVSVAGIADFSHYFVCALRPAPLMVALVQGPPAQFAPPFADWSIAWSPHPQIDTPANCSFVPLQMEYPSAQTITATSRKSLDIPDTAHVLASAGRTQKLQDSEFWKAICKILEENTNTYYVVIGAAESEIAFLQTDAAAGLRDRIRCLGWRTDVLELLAASDLVIDTFPAGGGQVLVQAMLLGVPFLAHRNDYRKRFDGADWSPAEDFTSEETMLVNRGDFESLTRKALEILGDDQLRQRLSAQCKQQAQQFHVEPGVRKIESIYENIIRTFSDAERF